MIRNLVISLGITTLSSFLLYMYFKNRMSDVENKVDIMFQLIQEHTAANEAAAAAAALQNNNQINSHPTSPQSYNSDSMNNLVDVSDDEMGGGSSSEEVSDSEDEETESVMPQLDESDIQNLRDNIFEEQESEIKKINLNIHGSETSPPENNDIVLDDLEDLNLESKQIESNQETDAVIEEVDSNNLKLDDTTELNLTMEETEDSGEAEKASDKSSDEEDQLNEITLEPEATDTKTIFVSEEVDLDPEILRKKTVAQLKEIAAQKNLQKYKSLTKKRLIDLISNSH